MKYIQGSQQKGFSLIETLISLAILGILVGIILSTLVTYNKTHALDKDLESIVETLRQARNLTLASKNANAYGVHFAPSAITLFTAPTYSSSDPANQVFTLQTSDIIVTISLTGGGSDVIFSKLNGETTQSGTIVVSSPRVSETKTVTIYKTGIIQYK